MYAFKNPYKKLIIVKLMGGLGNQLFQYGAGLAVARECGVPLKLDISWFTDSTIRDYSLSNFAVSAEQATPSELRRFCFRHTI